MYPTICSLVRRKDPTGRTLALVLTLEASLSVAR